MKAVLVIDMPECCDYCPVCRFFGMSGFTECTVMNDKVNRDGQTRPDWCPLKPFPETKEKLEDLEEQGKLVVLPCNVGDTVYELQEIRKRIQPMEIISVNIGRTGLLYFNWELKDGIGVYHNIKGFGASQLGKTVFLTKEEAKQALNERG